MPSCPGARAWGKPLVRARFAVLRSAIVRRVSMVGNAGSGKSTLARRLAATLGVPHLELDSVFHKPGWEALPPEEFKQAVAVRGPGTSTMSTATGTSRPWGTRPTPI